MTKLSKSIKKGLYPADSEFANKKLGGYKPCTILLLSVNDRTILSVVPKILFFSRCPVCNLRGRRFKTTTRRITHISYKQEHIIIWKLGVYRMKCSCGPKTLTAPVPGAEKGARYSNEVREAAANSLLRDRLPYRLVQQRMAEDYHLNLSLGYIHNCFLWAHQQINNDQRVRWAVTHFSGVLCVDEVHDGGRTLLYATDPLNDFTVFFEMVEKNDQEHMDAFLQKLKGFGIEPEVVITDGSPLYKDALQEIWTDCRHQLCLFHVFKDVNKVILDAVRAIKNKIKRQGNKGRRRRRGRPSRAAAKRAEVKRGPTKKEDAKFIWEHQYLIVRREDSLTEDDHVELKKLFSIAPELETLRAFVLEFYAIFHKDQTLRQARNLHTRLLRKSKYSQNEYLQKALKKIRKEVFEKLIVYLDVEVEEHSEQHTSNSKEKSKSSKRRIHGRHERTAVHRKLRTSNHVERNNRTFRMLQKTRYRRRKQENIKRMIELQLYQQMLNHPLKIPDRTLNFEKVVVT